jgi:aspartyl-tRNA(Asn)/glutamyl-tRNA(Gln) amidotransferase subunit B
LNRAGVPLLELVTEPVLRSPAECAAFLMELRRLVRWLGISDGDMEKGQLRCDANVSLRPEGSTALGTKTELKNLNSIKGVERGVTAEIARQAERLDAGERIVQATLLYDADHDRLAVMRTKEHAHDYRYFPDPDLPILRVHREQIARAAAPELPWQREARYRGALELPAYDAQVLTETRELGDYFEACLPKGHAKLASNWVMTEVMRVLKERSWGIADWTQRVPAARLRDLLARVAARELPGPVAKQVFAWLSEEDGSVSELLARHGVRVAGGDDELRPIVRAVLDENPGAVTQVLAGEERTFGFLVGQAMKKSGGQAVPQVLQRLLREELSARAARS